MIRPVIQIERSGTRESKRRTITGLFIQCHELVPPRTVQICSFYFLLFSHHSVYKLTRPAQLLSYFITSHVGILPWSTLRIQRRNHAWGLRMNDKRCWYFFFHRYFSVCKTLRGASFSLSSNPNVSHPNEVS